MKRLLAILAVLSLAIVGVATVATAQPPLTNVQRISALETRDVTQVAQIATLNAAVFIPALPGKKTPTPGVTPTVTVVPTATVTATATPPITATVMPPMAQVICGIPVNYYHPAVMTQADVKYGGEIGCQSHYENGDRQQDWVPVRIDFHDAHATGNIERNQKFWGMKAYGSTFMINGKPLDFYCPLHGASVPPERATEYHSFLCYFRYLGDISVMQGWYAIGKNTPVPLGNRLVRRAGVEDDTRPIALVIDENSPSDSEQWYSTPGGADANNDQRPTQWIPDFGMTFVGAGTYWRLGESISNYDVLTWPVTGKLATTRRFELSWFRNRADYAQVGGEFYTDQFGHQVSGPNDPRCGTQMVAPNGTQYVTVCLRQYIAPSLPTISFDTVMGENHNSFQLEHDDTGVGMPN